MYTDDHIIRLISQAVAALSQAIGLRKSGRYEDALQVVAGALEGLLGFNFQLLNQMDDDSLLYSFTQDGELNLDWVTVVANLSQEAGLILQALNRPQESNTNRQRALKFNLEVSLREGAQTPSKVCANIEELHQTTGDEHLPADILYPLFYNYEQRGSYALASEVMQDLLTTADAREELLPEAVEFYEQLLKKSDRELEGGGIRRKLIEVHLTQLLK